MDLRNPLMADETRALNNPFWDNFIEIIGLAMNIKRHPFQILCIQIKIPDANEVP